MVKPYNIHEDKKVQIENMFDNIAPKYDFLNHFLSLGIDKSWRKKVRKQLEAKKPKIILDLATGTGDLAIEILKINPHQIYGLDLSEKMLHVFENKVKNQGIEQYFKIMKGDAENIQFPDNHFDAVTVAFGVRNFENIDLGLSEIFRVLKDNGILIILEFSEPQKKLIKSCYNLYFSKILPYIAKIFSKDLEAYKYLPASVKKFPQRKNFIRKLNNVGFKNTSYYPLTFGVSTIYKGIK